MNKERFHSIISLIATEVVNLYSQNEKIDEIKATDILYKSKLYSLIEKEETGVWHYSPIMLYSLLKEEIATGKLTLPEEI